jgi:hypothetical protein
MLRVQRVTVSMLSALRGLAILTDNVRVREVGQDVYLILQLDDHPLRLRQRWQQRRSIAAAQDA